MSDRKPMSPIVRYMRMHDWEWLSEEQIIQATGCTHRDLQAIIRSAGYKQSIECKNGKFRYIGNKSSDKRKCVELLKDIYPEYLHGGEIKKRANMSKNAGWIITQYADVLPIESIVKAGSHGFVKQYRYIPDDERSLTGYIPHPSRKHQRVTQNKQRALRILTKHPDVWFSANEISARLGMSSCCAIAQMMIHVSDEHIHVRKDGTRNRRYYCYSEKIEC